MSVEGWLRVSEVAELFRYYYSADYIRVLARQGKVEGKKELVGRTFHWYINPASLGKYIASKDSDAQWTFSVLLEDVTIEDCTLKGTYRHMTDDIIARIIDKEDSPDD